MFDGPMAYEHSGDAPIYAPNSYGRGYTDVTGEAEDSWEADGEMVRAAYTLRPEDDDFGQPGTLVREVLDDAHGSGSSATSPATSSAGSRRRLLPQVFEYWKSVDADTGKRIEEAVHAGRDDKAPAPGPTDREGVSGGDRRAGGRVGGGWGGSGERGRGAGGVPGDARSRPVCTTC